jgi:hypothetical protein
MQLLAAAAAAAAAAAVTWCDCCCCVCHFCCCCCTCRLLLLRLRLLLLHLLLLRLLLPLLHVRCAGAGQIPQQEAGFTRQSHGEVCVFSEKSTGLQPKILIGINFYRFWTAATRPLFYLNKGARTLHAPHTTHHTYSRIRHYAFSFRQQSHTRQLEGTMDLIACTRSPATQNG